MERRIVTLASAILGLAISLSAAGSAWAQCVTSPMSGQWVSVNPATRGLTSAAVTVGCCDQVQNGVPVCSPPDSVQLFGRCHPTNCDWGKVSGHLQSPDGRRLTAIYNQGFAKRTVRVDTLANGNLRVRVLTDFVDPHRQDYNLTEIMRHP